MGQKLAGDEHERRVLNKAARSIAVFSGSVLGRDSAYRDAAIELARIMVDRQFDLVCGGANTGLMAVLANAVLDAGGNVTGVVPKVLAGRETINERLSSVQVVDTIDDRNALIHKIASAFISMPGGTGTVDELFRIFSMIKMGFISKPLGILNTAGFYDPIIELLATMKDQDFLKAKHLELCLVASDPGMLMDRLFPA